ncbi:tetratricopeptide repeat protein [Wenzhouxiangella marina]|nr:hypothetical protein [Wenzhouxiangella marina]
MNDLSSASWRYYRTRILLAFFAFPLGMLTVFLVYWQGITSPFHFDDAPNLTGLSVVSSSLESKLLFVFGGLAGPSGRPVSLASFLIDGAAWPHDSSVFVRTNILIHLINACLVCWIGLLIARARDHSALTSAWVGIIAFLLWATSPLLQSASFMVIQRMTTLSALFVFLGLVFHLKLREARGVDQSWKLLLLGLNVSLFTVLATLSKENGALLPALVLLVEWLLLKRPPGLETRSWSIWKGVFLGIPAILVLVFLVYKGNYTEADLLRRGFDVGDRLATEAMILWEYLAAAANLNPQFLNPYLDNYPIARSFWAPMPFIASMGWLILLVVAVFLRSKAGPAAFAICWYLVAHSVESTTIPLELVFQHRNYVPLVGIALAIPIVAMESRGLLRTSLMLVGLLLLSANIAQSRSNSWIWGDANRAAEYWLNDNPTSVRAKTVMLDRLIKSERLEEALAYTEVAEDSSGPENRAVFQLMRLRLICGPEALGVAERAPSLAELQQSLQSAAFSFALADSIRAFNSDSGSERCPWLDDAAVNLLLEVALQNPALEANHLTRFLLSRSIAVLAARNEQWQRAIDFYKQALQAFPEPGVLQQITVIHLRTGTLAQGCEYLASALDRGWSRPVLRQNWRRQVRALHAYLSREAMMRGADCMPLPN